MSLSAGSREREELEISLSTLDGMIRKGEIEVSREGRRVYVRMERPECLSDEEFAAQSHHQGGRA